AITSVTTQTHQQFEIIVVDDGSKDDTAAVCREFGGNVQYIRVERVGLPAARNIGAQYASGDYLVFLDADDFLYAEALQINLYFFDYYPAAVMVSGGHDRISQTGELLSTHPGRTVTDDNYEALLQGNYIAMEGAAMYRRELFPHFHFNTRLPACEDYDLNLRISSILPVFGHDKIVAAYRMHAGNMSANKSRMLNWALQVLQSQKPRLKNKEERAAWQQGLINWKQHYGTQ
ncbi:MAG: glycosyltransferase, partial [Sphingobacteriales bacterium]